MNKKDLGKALMLLLSGGLAVYVVFGVIFLQPANTHYVHFQSELAKAKQADHGNGSDPHHNGQSHKPNPYVEISRVSGWPTGPHSTNSERQAGILMCFSLTATFLWFGLVAFLCMEHRRVNDEKSFPRPWFGLVFGFLLSWAFMGLVLDVTDFYNGHNYLYPLGKIYFFLSAFLVYTFWLATADE